MGLRYYVGSDLPDTQVTLRNGDGTYPDFSSGYTFQVKVAPTSGSAATFTKTTSITGAAGSSTVANVSVSWATSGELNSLTAGYYVLQLQVTRTSDSRQWIEQFPIEIASAVT